MKKENIFKEAVDKFGVENQLLKLVEEMAELTQAIIKHRLYPDEPKHFNNLIEEMVDVHNVWEQLVASKLLTSGIALDLWDLHEERKIKYLESLLKTSEKTKVQN
jgi:hypothetical protein